MDHMAAFATHWSSPDRPASDETVVPRHGIDIDVLSAQAPRLRRLVHRLLGWRASAHDLDDIVQDVLLAAWRHRADYRGDAALSTWLTSIALRKAHNHVRSDRLRHRLFAWLGDREPTAAMSAPDERLDRTHRAMQRLAHADREVLVLRYLERRDIDEVAALLGARRAAIDSRLSRARRRLRAMLAEDEGR